MLQRGEMEARWSSHSTSRAGNNRLRFWLRFYRDTTRQNATKCVNLRKPRFAIRCCNQRTSDGFGRRRSCASQAGRRRFESARPLFITHVAASTYYNPLNGRRSASCGIYHITMRVGHRSQAGIDGKVARMALAYGRRVCTSLVRLRGCRLAQASRQLMMFSRPAWRSS